MDMNTNKPKTARHFEEGERITHKTEGTGVIHADARGVKFPKFDNGTTGTPYTRVWADPMGAPNALRTSEPASPELTAEFNAFFGPMA